MQDLKGLEWTFDTVALTYEKLRPDYADELYQAIYEYIPINKNSNVVEVGSGGGQATFPILKTGCQLTAVEYGEQFSKLLKEKFKEHKNFSVITGRFEDVEFEKDTFDLVFSAKEYIELLGTYSDHIAIEEKIRIKFFAKIEEAINRHGGTITIYDTMDLQLARK